MKINKPSKLSKNAIKHRLEDEAGVMNRQMVLQVVDLKEFEEQSSKKGIKAW